MHIITVVTEGAHARYIASESPNFIVTLNRVQIFDTADYDVEMATLDEVDAEDMTFEETMACSSLGMEVTDETAMAELSAIAEEELNTMKVFAPWSEVQQVILNEMQWTGQHFPVACDRHARPVDFMADTDGWVCQVVGCDNGLDWCWQWQLDPRNLIPNPETGRIQVGLSREELSAYLISLDIETDKVDYSGNLPAEAMADPTRDKLMEAGEKALAAIITKTGLEGMIISPVEHTPQQDFRWTMEELNRMGDPEFTNFVESVRKETQDPDGYERIQYGRPSADCSCITRRYGDAASEGWCIVTPDPNCKVHPQLTKETVSE